MTASANGQSTLSLSVTTSNILYVGTYSYTVTATAVGSFGSTVPYTATTTVTIILVDLCETTTLYFIASPSNIQAYIEQAQSSPIQTPLVRDSVSSDWGDGVSLCPTRTYTITTSPVTGSAPGSSTPTALTADMLTISSDGLITHTLISSEYEGSHLVTITVMFSDT